MAEIKTKIKKEEEFKRIRQSGRYWTGEYTRLILARTDDDQVRIAIVVSKKVSKLAVVRNKLRRRINAILKNIISDLGNVSFDLIVSGLPGKSEMEYIELKEDIDKGLKRLLKNEKSSS